MIAPAPFTCAVEAIHDGDTFTCANGRIVRLARIDAPDFRTAPKCRRNRKLRACNDAAAVRAREALRTMIGGRALWCKPVIADPRRPSGGFTSYGRIVARCSVNGADLSAAMRAGRYAVKWPGRRR